MNYIVEGEEIFSAISQKLKYLLISSEDNNHVPGFLHGKFLVYVVAAILAVKILTIVVYLPISHNLFFADITKIDLLNLLNDNRQSLGLSPLVENDTLNKAAMAKAQDMVKNGYFAHQSPQGVTPWFWFKQAGYTYKYAGENLAVGFFDSKVLYDAWFNSPSHKENLLNKNYTEVGTAILGGFEGNSVVVVQEFGSPLVKSAPVVATTKKPVVVSPPVPLPLPAPTQPPLSQSSTVVEATPVQENTGSGVTPRVLSQTTEYIVGPEHAGIFSWYLKFLNFIVYDNNEILFSLSWGVLLLIVICIAINVMTALQMPGNIVTVKALLLIAILIISMVLSKDVVLNVIPHQIII